MKPSLSASLRRLVVPLLLAMVLGPLTAAADQAQRIRGHFFCNAEDTVKVFNVPGTNTWLPETIDVVIAGAGDVSHMASPVACYSDDEHLEMFDPATLQYIGAGQLTSILRDRSGNTLTMKLEMYMDQNPTSAEHPITFHGTFVITGGTGRLAGATGKGTWTGWANKDDAPPADASRKSCAQGYWEFSGWITLPKHHPCD